MSEREVCLICCRPAAGGEYWKRDPRDDECEDLESRGDGHIEWGLNAMSVVLGTLAFVRWVLEVNEWDSCTYCGEITGTRRPLCNSCVEELDSFGRAPWKEER